MPPPTTWTAYNSTPNPDGSALKPWKTLGQMQEALAGKPGAGGGDVVRIAPGEYGAFIEGVGPKDESLRVVQRQRKKRVSPTY